MNGWMVLAIVLGVMLLGAIYEGVSIADQNRDLRVKLDRAMSDRDTSARVFAVRKLLEVAFDLHRFARGYSDPRTQDAIEAAARWVENDRVPEVAGLPREHEDLRAIADRVHHERSRGGAQ